jgi:ABC-2 type transport system permease protein
MNTRRIRTLIGKEFLDLRRNSAALLPVVLVTLLVLVLPFGIAVGIPFMTGHRLTDDSDLVRLSAFSGSTNGMSDEGRVQLMLFQQFLMWFLLIPITGAMALAAHAVVGEKQSRTLEPLLATPITTFELLIAKVLGSLLPTMAISFAGVALYFVGVAVLAEPGVAPAMVTVRAVLLLLLVGPASALVALQSAIIISSRVNDARTAQQFGVFIIIPLSALLVAQLMGEIWLTSASLTFVGLGLLGVWLVLTLLSVALFERESILTRWR